MNLGTFPSLFESLNRIFIFKLGGREELNVRKVVVNAESFSLLISQLRNRIFQGKVNE